MLAHLLTYYSPTRSLTYSGGTNPAFTKAQNNVVNMVIRSEDEAVLLEVWNKNMMTDALVRTCAHAVAEQQTNTH